MQPTDFKYILELQTYISNANLPFERRYFHSLHEAVINLLQIPVDRYWEANDPQYDKQISTIRVLEQNAGNERQIASIFEMPISDSLPDGPSAGIYLHNVQNSEGPIGDIEDMLAVSFYRLRNYDHDMPMVQIARYVYDDTLKLLSDPSLEQLIGDLQKKVTVPWEYELQVWDNNHQIAGNLYYHTGLPAAFDQLVGLPYFTPLPDGSPARFPEAHPTIILSDDIGGPVAMISGPMGGLSSWPQQVVPVQMEISHGLARLEAIAGVNLSEFDGYRQDGIRITIGHIDTNDNTFQPVPAFAQLQQGSEQPGPTRQTAASAYTLQLEYRQLKIPLRDPAITSAEFITKTYPDLGGAVAAMHNLEYEDFDVQAAVRNRKDKYLHEAVVYHTTGKYDVASMFRMVRPQEHVPAGVYVKVNAENLSSETLHAFKPFIQELAYKGPLLYLVKAENGQHQTLDRRRPGPRQFEGGSHRGL